MVMRTIILFVWLVLCSDSFAQTVTRAVERQFFIHKTEVVNPGAENGVRSWSATGGAFGIDNTLSNVASDKFSFDWDPSAAAQIVESSLILIPSGLKNANCLAQIKYKTDATDINFQVHDGTNIVAQLVDGSGIIPLSATDGFYRKEFITFQCPSSGSLKIRLVSNSNSVVINWDNVYWGENFRLGSVSQAELVAHIFYAETAGCNPTVDSGSFVTIPAIAACPSPTVIESTQVVNTTDDNQLNMVFNGLKPGIYTTVLYAQVINPNVGTIHMALRMISSTGAIGNGCSTSHTTLNTQKELVCVLTETITTAQPITYSIQAAENGSGAMTIANDTSGGDAFTRTTEFVITRKPLQSESVFIPGIDDYFINVTVGGAAASLPTSTTGAQEIINGSLSMVLLPDSNTAEIPCSTINPSTGLTCSVGSESIGIVAKNMPKSGIVELCAQFGVDISTGAGGAITDFFKWVETPNDAQSITLDGEEQPHGTDNASSAITHPLSVCQLFKLTTPGDHTFRLFNRVSASGTITSNSINATALKLTLRYETQNIVMPILVNSVRSPSPGQVNMATAFITGGGTPAVSRQNGIWVTSITDNGVGDYTVNFAIGTFDADVNCVCTGQGDASMHCGHNAVPNTSVQVFLFDETSSAAIDGNFFLNCVGEL